MIGTQDCEYQATGLSQNQKRRMDDRDRRFRQLECRSSTFSQAEIRMMKIEQAR